MESLGIVRRSNSPWSSPLHMVPKPNGSWRPCGDYRRLNAATTPDKYPLPNLQDLSNFLHGSTIFSKIDFVRQLLQSATLPSLRNHPNSRQGHPWLHLPPSPTDYQTGSNSVLRAAIFIQL
ncbi:MAG: hypothetical protein ACK56F_14695 [bacterium]